MRGLDALFGPSSMLSLIHRVQLELSGADLSFTAPLSLSATLREGPLLVSDMFQLYRFENMLYTMELSGAEVEGFLEYAAGLWFKHMYGPRDHLLLFDPDREGTLANPYYNFSSAAGINYTVDVSKPAGQRMSILGFSNGAPFLASETYRVAINSYRGNGGGGHLTRGAGIPAEELAGRITWSSDKDLRFYLMEYLSSKDTLRPETDSNWDIIPAEWLEIATENDLKYFN
jgi:2',3'-cyclic-nucleotide 2'-phosphodiesterase/3'-nucleotidase